MMKTHTLVLDPFWNWNPRISSEFWWDLVHNFISRVPTVFRSVSTPQNISLLLSKEQQGHRGRWRFFCDTAPGQSQESCTQYNTAAS